MQSSSDIGDDVTPYNIISKLSLLAIHFPRLRIVWSRSLHATAEIFASLKMNQDEPDEAKATRVGVPSEEGVVEDDIRYAIIYRFFSSHQVILRVNYINGSCGIYQIIFSVPKLFYYSNRPSNLILYQIPKVDFCVTSLVTINVTSFNQL